MTATATAPSVQPAAGAWLPVLGVVSVALFMTSLDNLVVVTALPAIRQSLGASVDELQWAINAYTVAFAVLLLPGAAIGDRCGRRRVFTAGVAGFTAASLIAARADSVESLVAARALQGVAAAFVLPLTLTLLNEVVPAARRGLAIGVWGGISGLGVALGPLVGGVVVQGASWQWIFWINVPVGVVLVLLSARLLPESYGGRRTLDPVGVLLLTVGLLALVSSLVQTDAHGWSSGRVLTGLLGGALLLALFALWQSRCATPMLPLRFFRSQQFTLVNAAVFAMFFGTFGGAFFMAQYFQLGLGSDALTAGLMTLPWTAAPMVVAPLAGAWSDRTGPRTPITAGLWMQAAAFAAMSLGASPEHGYLVLVPALLLAGVGMSLVLAPSAAAVLAAVEPGDAGLASGATNAIREIGGVFGVAVLVSVFSAHGSYASASEFAAGVQPALVCASAVLVVAGLLAAFLPGASAETPDCSDTGSASGSRRPQAG